MTQPPEQPGLPAPQPHITRKRWRLPLVWLVPVVAALVSLSLLFNTWLSAGPQITISFQSAAGLEAGKTPVKYKDVVIGRVSAIGFSDDRSLVIVTVDLDKGAKDFAREDARYWVVRPRIGVGGVSGIDTVLSGAYIGSDFGASEQERKDFVGLEIPPSVINRTPGRSFELHAYDLGSLDIGSPVYYRRIQVGQVTSYQLDADGKGVTLQIFVLAPNDKLVTESSRFWNASGVDVTLGADGLKLNTQSMATVLAGGIAFASFGNEGAPAKEQASFTLSRDRQAAMDRMAGEAQLLRMRFDHSLRGMAEDAPVEFLGMNIGKVISVQVDYDAKDKSFPIVVDALVYPQRLSLVNRKVKEQAGGNEVPVSEFVKGMVERGLRAQARTGNLLTGQLYIALDFVPNAPKVAFDAHAQPMVVPTVRSGFDNLQEQLAGIVNKVDKIPLDSIGRNLDRSLAQLDKTLSQVNQEVLPETKLSIQEVAKTMQQAQHTIQQAELTFGMATQALGEDAPLQQNITQSLQELQRSARSLRMLTDLLSRHPEALVRGLPQTPPAAATPAPQESAP